MLNQVLLLCLVFPYLIRCDDDYIEATADTFDSIIENNDLILVKFYAEWCGHCKRMAPEFAKAATELKNNVHPVTLVKVNCPNHQPLCERFGVSGYPTLKIFQRGDLKYPKEYQGGREASDIIKYMKGQAGPDSNLLNDEIQLNKLIENSHNSVFIAFVDNEQDPAWEGFKLLAKEFRDRFTFGHIFMPGRQSVRRYLPKLIQTKLEPEFEEISKVYQHDTLRKWLLEVWGGTLVWVQDSFSPESSELLDSRQRHLVTVFFELDYERDPKGTNYIRNRILKVAHELKKDKMEINFAMASATKNERMLESTYDLKWVKGGKPVVAAQFRNKKFVMREEFSYEALKKFAIDLITGKVPIYLKSEPIPDSQPDAVIKVVASSFDDVVRDQSKHVLIEFYAPWCGHCKSLKPVYEELAQKVKSKSDLVIAAMDATANDVPSDFSVQGFPTLYWVNKKNEISTYNGGRTVDDFLKFIESNTDHTFPHDEL